MNALALGTRQISTASSVQGSLTGFRNVVRKDLNEWLRTRRFFWTMLSAVGLMTFGVLAAKIASAVDPSAEVTLTASSNMYQAGWETFIPIFTVFSTMGLLTAERDGRTLAWTLSMPVTRMSVLVSKLLTSILALGVAVVLLPEIVAVAAVRLVYGEFPSGESMVWPELGGVGIALLLFVICLAMSVFFRGQRAVTGIALTVGLVIPGLIDGFWPAASPWWPVSIDHFAEDFGAGRPLQAVTPIVWLATIAVLAIAARIKFEREEL
jgi:ABC-type transport system involved in multi-copper enzyme maturation permease subunit